jgi:hypothetical protein
MDLFGQAVHAVRGLHDATGPREQRLLRGQQREISVGVRQGHTESLTDRQVADLLTATESTLATWAGACDEKHVVRPPRSGSGAAASSRTPSTGASATTVPP